MQSAAGRLALVALAAVAGVVAIVITGQDVPTEMWAVVATALGGAAGAAVPTASAPKG